jgi:hypothetical protein
LLNLREPLFPQGLKPALILPSMYGLKPLPFIRGYIAY